MQRKINWLARLSLVVVMLAGCSPAARHDTSSAEPTYTIVPIPDTPTNSPALPSAIPPLETITEPYENAGALLDGVCYEFLYSLNGVTWVWTTSGDLTAFYDRADASGLCSSPVTRVPFDFSGHYLAGAVQVVTGCDAAHRVIDSVTDDSARTQTIVVQLTVRGDCHYELVQPLLIAVPRLSEGYTLRIVLTP